MIWQKIDPTTGYGLIGVFALLGVVLFIVSLWPTSKPNTENGDRYQSDNLELSVRGSGHVINLNPRPLYDPETERLRAEADRQKQERLAAKEARVKRQSEQGTTKPPPRQMAKVKPKSDQPKSDRKFLTRYDLVRRQKVIDEWIEFLDGDPILIARKWQIEPVQILHDGGIPQLYRSFGEQQREMKSLLIQIARLDDNGYSDLKSLLRELPDINQEMWDRGFGQALRQVDELPVENREAFFRSIPILMNFPKGSELASWIHRTKAALLKQRVDDLKTEII
jgi:hypothetical protein